MPCSLHAHPDPKSTFTGRYLDRRVYRFDQSDASRRGCRRSARRVRVWIFEPLRDHRNRGSGRDALVDEPASSKGRNECGGSPAASGSSYVPRRKGPLDFACIQDLRRRPRSRRALGVARSRETGIVQGQPSRRKTGDLAHGWPTPIQRRMCMAACRPVSGSRNWSPMRILRRGSCTAGAGLRAGGRWFEPGTAHWPHSALSRGLVRFGRSLAGARLV